MKNLLRIYNRFYIPFLIILFTNQAAKAVEIVNLPLNSTYTNTAASYSAGNSGVVLNTNAGSVEYSGSNGATANSWNAIGKSWHTTAINTSDFYQISVTAQIKSSSSPIGPRDFVIQYSLNNTDWVDVQAVTMPTDLSSINPPISLPVECSFKPTVYLRFITTSTIGIGGRPTQLLGTSSIAGLVVAGAQLVAPTTQTSNIKVIAITPTSITISSSPGGGSGRIILMKDTNSFTTPTNIYNPSANPNYSGTGEQVIFNGTGTALTITVPSSTKEYWFRAYEYAEVLSQRRYLTIPAVGNPKQCLLESIILPTFSNVKLTSAVLGGTITNPPSGTITNRGIFWSTNNNVTVNDNRVTENGTGTGVFTFLVNNLIRSQTIYFKAFVDNLSGTSLSEELSFSNVPVFSGTGNWENSLLWNVKEVPGDANFPIGDYDDCPVINGVCTLSASSPIITNLTVNSGRKLIINPAQCLTSWGTVNNNAGTSGILIKSSSSLPNGSFIFYETGSIQASVEMYSKAFWDTQQYHWQYFGSPVQNTTVGTTFNVSGNRVRKYDESNIDPTGNDIGLWKPSGAGNTMSAGQTLTPVAGYEVVQPTTTTYTFKGNLNSTLIENYPLGYTAGADWQGDNIISNPYTAAINIADITSNNTDGVVYLYNTGSREQWESNTGASTDGESPGQYTASTGAFAGSLGTPSQIPSMQGFLVKATGPGATISLPYYTLVPNNKPQRVRKASSAEVIGTRIDVVALDKNYSDKMWVFCNDKCTRNFDRNYDGYKILGSPSSPQIYAAENDGDYQIDAVEDMNNTYLSFHAGSETKFKLKFTHQNIKSKYNKMFLVDLENNNYTTEITEDGSEYSFTALPSANQQKRFKIIAEQAILTSDNMLNDAENIRLTILRSNILIENDSDNKGQVNVFNMAGVLINSTDVNPKEIKNISNLPSGAYILKTNIGNYKKNQSIIIR